MKIKEKKQEALVTTDQVTGLITLPDDIPEDDNLGGVDRSEYKTPWWQFNSKLEIDGDQPPIDRFVNTATKEVREELTGVFISRKKDRQRLNYIPGEGYDILCRSEDLVTGFDSVVGEKACATCEHKEWPKKGSGKTAPECNEGWVFYFMDTKGELALIRFRKTSLLPMRDFLNEKIFNKRKLGNGNRSHLPLYVYVVRLTLRIESGKGQKYAVPIIEIERQATIEELEKFNQIAKDLKAFEIKTADHIPEETNGINGFNDRGLDKTSAHKQSEMFRDDPF